MHIVGFLQFSAVDIFRRTWLNNDRLGKFLMAGFAQENKMATIFGETATVFSSV